MECLYLNVAIHYDIPLRPQKMEKKIRSQWNVNQAVSGLSLLKAYICEVSVECHTESQYLNTDIPLRPDFSYFLRSQWNVIMNRNI